MKRSRLVAFTSSVLVPIISFALFTLADGPASRAQGQVATAQSPSSPGTSPTISMAANESSE
jgi:hypothetical protein